VVQRRAHHPEALDRGGHQLLHPLDRRWPDGDRRWVLRKAPGTQQAPFPDAKPRLAGDAAATDTMAELWLVTEEHHQMEFKPAQNDAWRLVLVEGRETLVKEGK